MAVACMGSSKNHHSSPTRMSYKNVRSKIAKNDKLRFIKYFQFYFFVFFSQFQNPLHLKHEEKKPLLFSD